MTPNEMIGSIAYFAGGFAPENTLLCDGRLLSVGQNQALFSVIGTQFGGDGRSTVAVPDLRGRVLVGEGASASGGPENWPVGMKFGDEVTRQKLELKHLPPHFHWVTFDTGDLDGTATSTADLSTLEMEVRLRCNSAASGAGPLGAYPGANSTADVWASSAPDAMAPDLITQASIDAVKIDTSFKNTDGGQPIVISETGVDPEEIEFSNMVPYTVLTAVITVEGPLPSP